MVCLIGIHHGLMVCQWSPNVQFNMAIHFDMHSLPHKLDHIFIRHRPVCIVQNGVVGKLTVRDSIDPHANAYDFDLAEHQILITDWDNSLADDKEPGIRGKPTLPDSILINGFGGYSNPQTNQNSYAPIEVFYVERGKKHRFRIANAGSYDCPLELSVRILF